MKNCGETVNNSDLFVPKKSILGRGRMEIVVEAVELAVDIVVVEVKVVEGEEEEDSQWSDLITELGDIVLSRHTDVM